MRMTQRLVLVRVTVGIRRHHGMDVRVVHVIVTVRMLVLQTHVLVFMRMALGEVKQDSGCHQRRTGQHPDAAAAFAESKRQ
jgi:hypothetical protein